MVWLIVDKLIVIFLLMVSCIYLYKKLKPKKCLNNCHKSTNNSTIIKLRTKGSLCPAIKKLPKQL